MKKRSVWSVLAAIAMVPLLLGGCGNVKQNETTEIENGKNHQSADSEDWFLYLKKNSLNKYSLSNKESVEVESGKNMYTEALKWDGSVYSEDGRYLYYIDYEDYENSEYSEYYDEYGDEYMPTGTLRVKDLQEPDKKAEKISSKTSRFQLLKNGNLLYYKNSSRGLYIWDGKTSNKITGVGEVNDFVLSEDESRLFFSVQEGEYMEYEMYEDEASYVFYTLYSSSLEGGEYKRTKLQDNIIVLHDYTKDLSRIYVSVAEGEDTALYCIKDLKEAVKIDQGQIGSLTFNENTGNIYYQKIKEEFSFYDLMVEDDLLGEDENIEIPSISEADMDKMQQEHKIIENKGLKEFALKTLHEELRNYLQNGDGFSLSVPGSYYFYDGEKSVKINELASKVLYAEGNSAFDMDFIYAWEEKTIEKKKFSELFDIYLRRLNWEIFSAEEEDEVVVEELLYAYYSSPESPLGSYFKSAEEEEVFEDSDTEYPVEGMDGYYDESVYDESEIAEGSDYEDYEAQWWEHEYAGYYASYYIGRVLENTLMRKSKCYILRGEEAESFEDLRYADQIVLDPDYDGFYYTAVSEEDRKTYIEVFENTEYGDSEGYDGGLEFSMSLYSLQNKGGSGAKPLKVDDDVDLIEKLSGEEIYYWKNRYIDYYTASLFVSGRKIGDDIQSVYFNQDGIYIAADPDANQDFTLYAWDGESLIKIGDEVHSFYDLGAGKLVYIDQYSSSKSKGVLKLRYEDGKVEEIDKDVSAIMNESLGNEYANY